MKENKSKIISIFLCIIIAVLFAFAITFTLIKNDMKAKEKYYNDQNSQIEELLDEED